jgi:hypothetical protein
LSVVLGCSSWSRPKPALLPVILIFACVFAPSVACANPVIINPSSLLAFCVVAFWAVVVEAGVVALVLAIQGVAALRVFVAYFILNCAVFLFIFQPLLLSGRSLPVPVLEAMVVLIDASIIKLLVTLNPFQGDGYRGVGWLRSLVTSGIGNTLSYLVSYMATRKPWETAS